MKFSLHDKLHCNLEEIFKWSTFNISQKTVRFCGFPELVLAYTRILP